MKVEFSPVRETKNTIRFEEIVSGLSPAKIGTLYVKKKTLVEMGYSLGTDVNLIIELT